MEALYIPQLLNAVDKTRVVSFQERLPGLDTLTPIKGELTVKHQVNYLEVKAQAEAIMTLTCNRCLQNFNHRLSIDTSELIWLEVTDKLGHTPLEREVALDDLVESLSPQGYFHPSDWLYEQVCLAIPHRQICQADCPGIQAADEPNIDDAPVDHRWATLAALKTQLPDS
ncbi:MAG: YceD family protein [Leptolyngbyaceae cyanobacterium MO_188.B28]|nr:YceD family protein [Leptolyngbyaceae cyanobacterium MO_188.B28]